jgi:DNA-binding NtrC family response regulator
MPASTQVKLLRVLQSGELRRVGGNRVTHADTRVIASTNKDLARETQQGQFREDLFYRLSVLTLRVPPLRERKQEIPHLVAEFLQRAATRSGVEPKEISDEALNVLLNHDWPGNVRELENIIELASVLSDTSVIRASDLPPHLLTPRAGSADSPGPLSLEQVQIQHLLRVLKMNNGNKRKTARDLEIDTKTLYNKLKKLDVKVG